MKSIIKKVAGIAVATTMAISMAVIASAGTTSCSHNNQRKTLTGTDMRVIYYHNVQISGVPVTNCTVFGEFKLYDLRCDDCNMYLGSTAERANDNEHHSLVCLSSKKYIKRARKST